MTDASLKDLLRSSHDAKPCALPLSEVDGLKRAADELQFPFAHLDLSRAEDKDDLLAALSLALRLPDWFGHNWDALADCLCDLSWKPAPGYVLYMEGYDTLRRKAPADIDTLIAIFAETANYWREEQIPFWPVFSPPLDDSPFLPKMLA